LIPACHHLRLDAETATRTIGSKITDKSAKDAPAQVTVGVNNGGLCMDVAIPTALACLAWDPEWVQWTARHQLSWIAHQRWTDA